MNSEQPTLSFEQSLEALQSAVKQLEGGELSLGDSLKIFEDGIKLSKNCQEHLHVAQQKVEILLKDSATGKPAFQDFK